MGLLQEKEELTVQEVCSRLGISEATARREFGQLEAQLLAQRFWGGIRLARPADLGQVPVLARQEQLVQEKEAIARAAAEQVADGEVVMIDGGSTTVAMVPFLANRPVQIITNSLLIAYEFDRLRPATHGGAEVLLTGGMLYRQLGLLTGPQSRENLRLYHASKAFISVGALDADFATNHHQMIVDTELVMLEQSAELVLLADHSKLGRRHMCQICPTSRASVIITNAHPRSEAFFSQYPELAERVCYAG